MLRNCACFIGGAFSLYFWAEIPSAAVLFTLLGAALILLASGRVRPLSAYLTGFVFICLAAQSELDDRLPVDPNRRAITTEFLIVDFPQHRKNTIGLLVQPAGDESLPSRIKLSWHKPPVLPQIGEVWHLRVRMRAPRGFSNPGLFDYEAWLLQHGIGATGYVVASSKNSKVASQGVYGLAGWRGKLGSRLARVLPDDEVSAVLLALTVGGRHKLSSEQWELFASTGTSHLMAISGLHIGLAAGGAYLLAQLLLLPWARHVNLRDGAAIAALMAAIVYALISGMAVPARRAVIMLCLVLVTTLWRIEFSASRVFILAALVTCLTDPLAIFTSGYLLSFAAVLALLWTAMGSIEAVTEGGLAKRLALGGRRLAVLQLVLLLGLLPLVTALFGRVSLVAPFVNMLVLPIFSFLVVPAALLGLLLGGILQVFGDLLLWLAYYGTCAALQVVGWAASWPGAGLMVAAIGWYLLPVGLLTMGWVVLPRGFLGRAVACPAALFLVVYRPLPPPPDCAAIDILDVGQGLAAVIRTQGSTIVYDAGPRFMSGTDTGTLVVVPYLQSQGIRDLDMLVISHSDLDHAGGSESVMRAYPAARLVVGEALRGSESTGQLCSSGQSWNDGDIEFRFLQPPAQGRHLGNNSSCVLRVSAGNSNILFTGDIERSVERQLVQTGVLNASTVVIVPHHGSRTSSSAEFVARLRPQLAIVSSGYQNRWGFPKPDVVARWQGSGAQVLNTADSGALSFNLCADSGLSKVERARPDQRKFWSPSE